MIEPKVLLETLANNLFMTKPMPKRQTGRTRRMVETAIQHQKETGEEVVIVTAFNDSGFVLQDLIKTLDGDLNKIHFACLNNVMTKHRGSSPAVKFFFDHLAVEMMKETVKRDRDVAIRNFDDTLDALNTLLIQ